MAERTLTVRILGDASVLERSFNRAGRSSAAFEHNLGRATRGALAGSGAFHSLGRSIAFASGGFLAFAGAGEFLRKSIDAAREAQVTQKQLAAQFRAAGQSLAVYQDQINQTTDRLSLLAGFENDQLKAAFTTIFRTTGDVNKSLRDLATAADLARAKHIDLNQAAVVIAKTEAGNTTLLRRQGLQIAKNASVEEALAQVRRQLAGQARAGTTAQERFGAVLHNTEEIIGAALLPTLNKYLNSGAKWLTQMNESGRLQRDVATAGHILGDAIAGVRAVTSPLVDIFKALGQVTGGTRNEVKLLAGAFVVLKLRAKALAFAEVIGGMSGIGTAAATSTGQVAGLRGALIGLSRLGAITIPLILAPKIANSKLGKRFGLDFSGIDLIKKIGGALGIDGDGTNQAANNALLKRLGQLPAPNFTPDLVGRRNPGSFDFATPTLGAPRPSLTAAQLRAISLAGNPTAQAIRAQIAFDQSSLAAIKRRFDAGKISAKTFTDETIRFTNDLAQYQSQLAAMLATETKKAQTKAKAAARLNLPSSVSGSVATPGLVRPPQRVTGSFQFLRDSFSLPLRLQLEAAKAAAQSKDLTPILRREKVAIQKALHSGMLSGQAQIDAWNAISGINDQLGNQSKTLKGKFVHADPNKILAGRGLTPDQIRSLAPSVATIGFGGKVPAGQSVAFRQRDIVVHTHLRLDGKEIASSTTRHQQRDSQRRAVSRRGPYAGRH